MYSRTSGNLDESNLKYTVILLGYYIKHEIKGTFQYPSGTIHLRKRQ